MVVLGPGGSVDISWLSVLAAGGGGEDDIDIGGGVLGLGGGGVAGPGHGGGGGPWRVRWSSWLVSNCPNMSTHIVSQSTYCTYCQTKNNKTS